MDPFKDILPYIVPAILGLPLLGFIITGLGGRFLTSRGARLIAAYIAVFFVTLSLVLSIWTAYILSSTDEPFRFILYTWIPSGDFTADIGLWVDRLTAVMLLVVTGVATLVHIYAVGYMKDDGRDPSVEAHGGHGEGHGAADSHAVHDTHTVADAHHDAHGADSHDAHGAADEDEDAHGPAVIPANLPGEGGWRVGGGLQKDGGLARFFSFLNLFVFSMLVLVLANNYLMLFVGWELVGLSSYLLIGFWYQKRDIFEDLKGFFRRDVPFEASKKAFIVNRIGDFGFATGIMLMFVNFGTLAYGSVFPAAATQSEHFILGNMTIMCLLLFMGAMGKSAQFPLHVWLPDAMAGPTPVSALIHAATMVTAGVYMVARSNPLFHAAPDAMMVVLILGTITALLGATIA
jgi:NADH:ubiquinone oxidoreductase subunit 5 (subunit L)/multisubunit Na+/H+ antiporter MnhA subunit